MLLVVWGAVYWLLRDKVSRKEMLVVSLWTSLLGLTEPIFVPEYWNPPSLFNLAQSTGFDIESLLFSFGVGGLAVVMYEWLFKVRHRKVSMAERHHSRHKHHWLALSSAPVIFFTLLIFVDINPIYFAFAAMMAGGLFTWYCRPDLKKKMIVSAWLFLGLYYVYFLTLIVSFPGYVEQVWNMTTISGVIVGGVPLEELMFAFSFGFLWSSVYEHIGWRKVVGMN